MGEELSAIGGGYDAVGGRAHRTLPADDPARRSGLGVGRRSGPLIGGAACGLEELDDEVEQSALEVGGKSVVGAFDAVVHDPVAALAGFPQETAIAVGGVADRGFVRAVEPIGPQGRAVLDGEEVVAGDADAAVVGHHRIVGAVQTQQ